MRRATALILAFQIASSGQAAPVFVTGTGDITPPTGYVNLGLQGVGRISASKLDAFGETFGSISGLQISNWKVTNGVYSGSFLTLPDRGYNGDAGYSAFRTRIQQLDFSFTPYTGSSALPAALSSQNQITLDYKGGSLLKVDGAAKTTGDLPTAFETLKGGVLGTVGGALSGTGKVALDAEGLAQFKDGSGYISDEYGPNIYYFDQNRNLVSVVNPPASALPLKSGTYSFTSASDPTTGRRGNQGMESIAISPDGTRMYAMLQSATIQDSGSKSKDRQFTRLYTYDISTSKSAPTLIGEYVVELPRFDEGKADQTGVVPNKTGAQSELVMLDNNRMLMLSRDGVGNGITATGSPVFKSIMLLDLSAGATNILSLDTTAGYSVTQGTASGNLVTKTYGTATETTVQLKSGITAVDPVQVVSIINQSDLARFGLNTNSGAAGAARNSFTLSEKWEGMSLVSALDPNKPNDYFLFVANDNDFLTNKMKMKAADGSTFTSAPLGINAENDTMFLVYRITIPVGTTDTSLTKLAEAATSTRSAFGAVIDAPADLATAVGTVNVEGTTLVLNKPVSVARSLELGASGGALNLQGNAATWSGVVQGSGGFSVFGSGSAKLVLSGSNTYSGGTEISGTRVEVVSAANLGAGSLNLNAGATFAVAQSGTFTVATGFYVDGGTIEIGSGKVGWTGSLTGPGSLSKAGTGTLSLRGAGAGYTGTTKVLAGVLEVESQTALSRSTLDVSGPGATAVLSGGSVALGGLSGTQAVTLQENLALSIGWNNESTLYSGILSGKGASVEKAGTGTLTLASTNLYTGGTKVSAGTLSLGTGTAAGWAGTSKITLGSKTVFELNMSGVVDLSASFQTVAADATILWRGADSNSILRLPANLQANIYNTGAGKVQRLSSGTTFVDIGTLPVAIDSVTKLKLAVAAPTGVTGKTLLYINGSFYQPFSKDLAVGTPTYLDATGGQLRATQRSLGDREVAYKKQFFLSLAFAGVDTAMDSSGNIIYNYGTQSTSTTLPGYWTKKNLPIIIGVDGNAYITDGHHTSAGYLETSGSPIVAGKSHIVLGTVQANPSTQTSVNDQMWADFAAVNNAYLYGPNGNQLVQSGETGYTGLQPILPSVTGMPTTPGTATMDNDLYRSLMWAAADSVVKTATSSTGSKIAGFSKVDSTSSVSGKEVNFVEFYWGDFLRNRVLWNDNAAVTSLNLINAPVSFFAASANAVALARSELYRDQYGRNLTDYTAANFSANTQTWANASIKNGLAVTGDTYNIFLTDDVSIQGDILPSGLDGVVNHLNINTTKGLSIAGDVQNFTTLVINTGGTMTIDWKDSAVNAITQNKTLTIAPGTADVLLSGDNDYAKLQSIVIGAGTLTLQTSNSVEQEIWGDISGAGAFRKSGTEKLSLSGSNTFTGGLFLDEGVLVLGSATPIGSGTFTAKSGTTIGFEESVLLQNRIRFVAGTDAFAPFTLDLGENTVEFAGTVTGQGTLVIKGQESSVLTLSGKNQLAGAVDVTAVTLRLSGNEALSAETITLRAGAAIQAKTDLSIASDLILEDAGRLDSGENLLEWTGEISGDGQLTISGHPYGRVRLSGLNTYTGGTVVEQARLEIGSSPAGSAANDPGYGQALGSGAVRVNSGVLGFAVSATVPNDLEFNGTSGIDVGDNIGELTGYLSGDGTLLVSGSRTGALFLNNAINTYVGSLTVEGTILRLLSTGGAAIFGENTHPVTLDDAVVQIVPDGAAGPVSFGARGLVLGALGGTLDVTSNSVLWDGVISGLGKFTVAGELDGQLELTATNTYKGGTDITGGTLLKFSRDANLGDAAGAITLTEGGLVYGGTQGITMNRSLAVNGYGIVDSGSQTVTWAGAITGGGLLELGRLGSTGTFVLPNATAFTGRTFVAGGNLTVGHKEALKQSTLETSATGGVTAFTTSEALLGGLAGDGNLALPSNFKLSIGNNNSSSLYSGVISGAGASLVKVGLGNLTLGGANSYTGTTSVSKGTLTLDMGASVGTGAISLESKVSLVINGSGTVDLSGRFDVSKVAADAVIVFRGGAGSILKLPKAVTDKLSVLNLGAGKVQSVDGSTITELAASTRADFKDGVNVALPKIESAVTLSGSAKLTITGSEEIKGSFLSGGKDSTLEIPVGVSATLKEAATGFAGSMQADGTINIDQSNTATQMLLPAFKGTGKVEISNGGKVKLAASSDFSGTTSLGIGAAAELTGSLGVGGVLSLGSGASVNVNPTDTKTTVTVPKLTGASGTSVALKGGKVELSGDNSGFAGTITVDKGVAVTVTGDLPMGTITAQDKSVPLMLDASGGNMSLPGTISGNGGVSLASSGTFTMTSDAKIQTAELKIGATATDKPTLDVSSLVGGLVLTGSQTLSGGGTVVGSITSRGVFSPGNSPGTFTVATKTTGATVTGGDLTIGNGGTVLLEYGVVAPSTALVSDQVVVAGTLTFDAGSSVLVRPFGSFVTPATKTYTNVFTAGTITGYVAGTNPAIRLETSSYLLSASLNAASATALDLTVTKDSYGLKVTPGNLQRLGNYLSAASFLAPSASLTDYLSVLDISQTRAALESGLQALSSTVYSESQRLSLRRTAAMSDTLQNRLTSRLATANEGWSFWSETYAWSFHRDSTALTNSWNGNTFGEVAGVQHTQKGLTFGVFGAAGRSSASFSAPSSSLKADSFHGGAFAHLEAGVPFVDASFLVGNADNRATRMVSLGTYGAGASAKFDTTEYGVHLRSGLRLKAAENMQLTPSMAVQWNGYNQSAVNEAGAGGASVLSGSRSANAVQTRLGTEAARGFKLSGKEGQLTASAYWLHDFGSTARSVKTRFAGAASSVEGYESSGEALGADAFELGFGAQLGITSRTSLRASGAWQIRDGSNQPGFNIGVTVQF
jgi:autotransporter-associated beta strand protein